MKEWLISSGGQMLEEYGLWGLLFLAFTEGFINPIPITPLLPIFGVFFPNLLYWGFLLALLTNIMGGVLGYFLGRWLGHPVFVKLFGQQRTDKVEAFFLKWGVFGVFIAAFTPIPFKIAVWAAGIFEMPFWRFFFAAVLGRTLQFTAVLLVTVFGIEFFHFLMG